MARKRYITDRIICLLFDAEVRLDPSVTMGGIFERSGSQNRSVTNDTARTASELE